MHPMTATGSLSTARRRRTTATRLLVIGAALLATLALAGPGRAITFGQLDDPNDPLFPNVGALLVDLDDGSGPFPICSGTLIAPRTFLTAAHCIAWTVGMPSVAWSADFGHDATDPSGAIPGTAVMHPGYPGRFGGEHADIAVLVLDWAPGIEPAMVAPAGYLNGLMKAGTLRSKEFTTAGFGTIRDDKTRAWQAIGYDGLRRWATQSAWSLQKPWLLLSMNPSTGSGGTCYGDSGGPHFVDGYLVSLTVTGDRYCRATDMTYRVDTPSSLGFLAPYLP